MANRVRHSDTFNAGITPMVVWRCIRTHRVLRVYLTGGGWQLIGDDFPVADYRVRAGIPDDDPIATNVVSGVETVLPLDVSTWPGDWFEVGCNKCRDYQRVPLAWLAEDCAAVKDTRKPVARVVAFPV